jgi:hypothetical protein
MHCFRDGEPLRSPSSHNIRPRGPVHLLPVGRPLQPAQHPAPPDYCLPPTIQQAGRTLPPPPEGRPPHRGELDRPPSVGPPGPLRSSQGRQQLHPRSGSVRLTTHFTWPILDSPELPSKTFLEQFSKTLSAAEHSATRHNTAAAPQPPPQLPVDLARTLTVFVRRDGHVPPLQPLYDGPYTVIRRSLHYFTLRIDDKEDKVSTLRLKPCTDPSAPPALPRVWGCPPAAVRFRGFPPPGAKAARRVHFAPQQPAEPRLACCQGFLHALPPFSTPLPLGPPATAEHCPDKTSRPPTSRPGGSPVEAS